MTGIPAIPSDIREAALRLGAVWFERDGAVNSVALIDDFSSENSDVAPSDDVLRRHHREVYAPAMMEWIWKAVHERLASGPLTLWRSVRLDGDPAEALREGGLGIYWSIDRDQAHAHDNASGSPAYLLEGSVGADGIDWVETLAAATHPDWVGEDEVRLLPDASVVLLSVHRREGWLRRTSVEAGEPVDVGILVGTTFRAGRDAPTPAP